MFEFISEWLLGISILGFLALGIYHQLIIVTLLGAMYVCSGIAVNFKARLAFASTEDLSRYLQSFAVILLGKAIEQLHEKH